MILRNTMTYSVRNWFAASGCRLVRRLAVSRPRPLRDRAAGYELTVLVDGAPARTYMHGGESYVLGQLGSHYTLRISNHTGRRVEAVVSVDGRDAIDGKPADWRSKRGYLVPPGARIDIEGWRISHSQAAAFRFSSVPDSYAARTGSAREVGVIGVAVFPERTSRRASTASAAAPVPSRPYPYDYDDYRRGADEGPRAERQVREEPPARRRAPRRARQRFAPARRRRRGGFGRVRQGLATRKLSRSRARSRPGLGTEYGEAVNSRIYEVQFVRANPSNPSIVLGVRYNDRDGLIAMGIPVDSHYDQACYDTTTTGDVRRTADPFPVADRRFAAPPPDGSALAVGGKPGEDRRWVANDEADEVLLQAYRAGDVRAFERLVARYEKPIWNFLRRFVADAATAEDLLQEVFLRVVKSADEWRGAAKFSTWLYTIARNLDRRSRAPSGAPERGLARRSRAAGSDSTATLHDRLPSPDRRADDLASDRQTKRRIDEAVAALPAEQREVFLMREVMEMPFAEIATAVGASEPTVKSRMRYALEKLRAALVELGGEPPSAAESSGSG